MSDLTPYFKMAVENVAAWGDTDVFPLPPENRVFFDRPHEVVSLLEEVHVNFPTWRDTRAPINESAVAMVGYTAFRWVSQIDPIWNVYLLGLVLSVAADIERARIPYEQRTIFSYRFDWDSEQKRLFRDGGWPAFNERSLELAEDYNVVLVCDIADFYARVNHHRLENSVLFLGAHAADTASRINRVLNLFSGGVSYGLPVGGPAARILSELLLNRVDRLLLTAGITFCRFADDYHIFVPSQERAYEALKLLTEKLLQNEGLTLQRAKTRIITAKDFRASSELATPPADPPVPFKEALARELSAAPATPEELEQQTYRSFLALSLRYDPYSPTADEDYEALKEQVERFDILGMLARELSKSRIHTALTRRLVRAIRYLQDDAKNAAARTLVDNLPTLAPVLPNVFRALKEILPELEPETQIHVVTTVQAALTERRYFITVPINLGYAVRLLADSPTDENQALLGQLFDDAPHFVQRDIVLIMARWRATYWLSDIRTQFSRLHAWVQRAVVIASYVLADEGEHWRRRVGAQLSPFDSVVNEWMNERAKTIGPDVPL